MHPVSIIKRQRRDSPLQDSMEALNLAIPEGHVGPMALPGTGRLIYWTGRVAIGLRHQIDANYDQEVMRRQANWLDHWMDRTQPKTVKKKASALQ